jgi:hypothetical protein
MMENVSFPWWSSEEIEEKVVGEEQDFQKGDKQN